MKIDPGKVYLVRGSTLARLQDDIRRRTPIDSNSQQRYEGPLGFVMPRGGGAPSSAPFQVSVRGDEIFVEPGLISVANWNGIPFVPRTSPGGPRLDELPPPPCGKVSIHVTHVHLSFDCELIGNPIEGYFEGGRVLDCYVELAGVLLPHRQQQGPDQWLLRVPIGRAVGGRVVSLLNSNLHAYFLGPYNPWGDDVEGSEAVTAPTLALFTPTGLGGSN